MSTENRPRTTAECLTLTVGQTSGHLCGSDEKPIQAALDYLRRLGGGCVSVGPGVYDFRAPLMMAPSVKLVGTGGATVLRKMPSHRTPVIRDADWYEARVDVEDPSGFEPGDGIMMQATPKHGKRTVVKRIVTAVEGQSIHLSDRLMDNLWLDDDAFASTLFPLITADELTHDVTVEDLVLDGNRDENDEINGNYAGGVFIQRCDRWQFNRVTSRNYNGDGFSFQVCDDVEFHECASLNNANLGFHPAAARNGRVLSTVNHVAMVRASSSAGAYPMAVPRTARWWIIETTASQSAIVTLTTNLWDARLKTTTRSASSSVRRPTSDPVTEPPYATA